MTLAAELPSRIAALALLQGLLVPAPSLSQAPIDLWQQTLDAAITRVDAGDPAAMTQAAEGFELALELAREPGFPELLLADSLVHCAAWCHGGADEVAFLEGALEIRIRQLGQNAPEVADLLIRLEGKTSRWADSRSVFERALSAYRTSLGEDHPKVAYAMMLLGMLDRREEKLQAAEQRFREALVLCPVDGEDPEGIGRRIQVQLIELLEAEGRFSEASALGTEFEAASDEANRSRRH